MRKIKLTQDKYALVDDEDFERLNKHKWYARCEYYNHWTAMRKNAIHNGKPTTILMHRIIIKAKKGQEVDHRNHNGLDNQKNNLRICTNQQNQWNQRRQHRITTSKYKGVYWDKDARKWRTLIGRNNKQIHLGLFTNEIDAAKAYDKRAQQLFGEFAYPNFR